ncbi:MAG: endonuclease [Acidimicrobiales bacterium]|nr:endonuclease [Acidimicrobiales bacterium]
MGEPSSVDAAARLAPLSVVTVLTAVTLELLRSTGPLLDAPLNVGLTTAIGAALLTFAGAGLWALGLVAVARRADAATAMFAGTIALVAARLLVQGLTGMARVWVGLTTASLSIAVLTIAVAIVAGREEGGRTVAGALAAGAGLNMGMQLALGTWDAYWRHDWLGWAITVVVLLCLVGAAQLARREPTTPPTYEVRRLWVLGPAFALLWMAIANSGFAASQSGTRLAFAGPIAGLGLLFAGWAASTIGRWPAPAFAIAPAVAIAGVFWTSGPVVLVFLVGAQLATFAVIAEALDRGTAGRSVFTPRIGAAATLVGLGAILPLLLFQLDYRIPLGFPNELVIVATAVFIGAAVGLRRPDAGPRESGPLPLRPIGRPASVLMVATGLVALLGIALTIGRDIRKPVSDTAADDALTLVSWNLHYGVDPDAGVDLEEIARSIEEHNPAVVTLQEVSRGWVLGGGADMATWLAQRLEMDVVYAPAADRQMGNAVLTNLPVTNTIAIELPYGQGPQERSAISVDIARPGGFLRVVSVHLQNPRDFTETRLDQIERLLQTHSNSPVIIIAGDFNAQPGWPEIDAMTGPGLISAQDVSGDPTALTDPSTNPEKRIDWVFGRGVTFLNTEVLADALSSDHLPLVVVFDAP